MRTKLLLAIGLLALCGMGNAADTLYIDNTGNVVVGSLSSLTGAVNVASVETPVTSTWTATSNGTNFTVTLGAYVRITMTTNMYLSAITRSTNHQNFVASIKGAGKTFNFGLVTNLYGAFTTNGVTLGASNSVWKLVIEGMGVAGSESASLTPPNK